jgi:hypothetical protein
MIRGMRQWTWVLGLLAWFAGDAAAQVYEIRPRYEPGRETIWRHRMYHHQVLRNPNTKRGPVTKISLVTGFRTRILEDQRPNHHPIEVTYLLFVHGFRGPTRYEFDSRTPEECRIPAYAAMAESLLDVPFQVILDDNGDVTEVKGLEQFPQRDWEGVPPFLKNFYLEFISPQTLTHVLMLDFFKDAPDEVARNEGWTTSLQSTQAGGTCIVTRDLTMMVDATRLVDGRSVARVTMAGPVSQTGSVAVPEDQQMTVSNISGEETGTMYVDIVNGELLSASTTQIVHGEMQIKVEGGTQFVTRQLDQRLQQQLAQTTMDSLNWTPPEHEEEAAPVTTQPAAQTQPAGT